MEAFFNEWGRSGKRSEVERRGAAPFVQTLESVMCRVAFFSRQRRGGFDSQDFPSFIHTANDITEIVFVALPRRRTPGKAEGGGGGGHWGQVEIENNWEGETNTG